jgi:hypothetical protein
MVREPDRARTLLGPDVAVLAKDAFDLVSDDLRGFDVIIDAFSTAPAQAYRHLDFAARLVSLLRGTQSPRLFFILGAGSLVTGQDHHLLVEDLRRSPGAQAWIAAPENQLKELRFLQEVDNVNCVAVSPSQAFTPGKATGFVLGRDELLVAPDGSSHVSTTRSDLALCQVIFFSAGSGGTTVGPVWDQPESNTTGLLFASFAACWRPGCRAGWALSGSSG